jgi:hypothetical protein
VPDREVNQDDSTESDIDDYVASCPNTTYAIGNGPSNGRASFDIVNGKFKLRYVPRRGFSGIDVFTIIVTPVSGNPITITIRIRVLNRALPCDDLFKVTRRAPAEYRLNYPIPHQFLSIGLPGQRYDRLVNVSKCINAQPGMYDIDWSGTVITDSTKNGKLLATLPSGHLTPNYLPNHGFYGLDSFQVRFTTYGRPPQIQGLQRTLYFHINVRRP